MKEVKDVCDCVCVDIVERYSITKQLAVTESLNKKIFTTFKNKLRIEEVGLTTEACLLIDKEKGRKRLETELCLFYSRSDKRGYCKLTDPLRFILENNLDDVHGEIKKLINIHLKSSVTTLKPE